MPGEPIRTVDSTKLRAVHGGPPRVRVSTGGGAWVLGVHMGHGGARVDGRGGAAAPPAQRAAPARRPAADAGAAPRSGEAARRGAGVRPHAAGAHAQDAARRARGGARGRVHQRGGVLAQVGGLARRDWPRAGQPRALGGMPGGHCQRRADPPEGAGRGRVRAGLVLRRVGGAAGGGAAARAPDPQGALQPHLAHGDDRPLRPAQERRRHGPAGAAAGGSVRPGRAGGGPAEQLLPGGLVHRAPHRARRHRRPPRPRPPRRHPPRQPGHPAGALPAAVRAGAGLAPDPVPPGARLPGGVPRLRARHAGGGGGAHARGRGRGRPRGDQGAAAVPGARPQAPGGAARAGGGDGEVVRGAPGGGAGMAGARTRRRAAAGAGAGGPPRGLPP
mmetsp:Transcript_31968/g.69806  ORF Transcript_31968/g.69806 Transcript_31968/m.69806 type:complete len:388 (-) Transcript_31968:398-1561(-)